MRIFLDANILFSAAKSAGAIRDLLDLLLDARHELVVDAYVVEEARRNLAAKVSGTATAALSALLRRMRLEAVQPLAADLEALRVLPEKDRPVLASAIRHRCDALVTGDRRHFGAFYGKRIGGVAIHSPRSLAESILG